MKLNGSVCWWLKGKRLCLASASSRRLALLQQVGLDPEVQVTDLDETQWPGESVRDYIERMARSKAQADFITQADLIIGADTVVVVAGDVLGKPHSHEEARKMLQRMGGREHQVMTAVAVYHPSSHRCLVRIVETRVWVKPLSPEEISAYVATGEPLDKAGAYGIQGVGAFIVTHIDGSYSGVVGLPLYETLALLREFA